MNILTIDLENWYPSEYYSPRHPDDRPTLKHLDYTLRLLRRYGAHATFFTLGELAERSPQILQEIHANDHEIAYHSHHHTPLPQTPPQEFEQGLRHFRGLAQDQTGERPLGFRAPLFSLRSGIPWALHSLEAAGFSYDSSIFPAWTPLYGHPDAPTQPYHPDPESPSRPGRSNLWELPLHTTKLGSLRLPTAGGFYSRLLPVPILERSLQRNQQRHHASVLYFHPRELDPSLTRVPLGPVEHFMIYFRIGAARPCLEKLLSRLQFHRAMDLIQTL